MEAYGKNFGMSDVKNLLPAPIKAALYPDKNGNSNTSKGKQIDDDNKKKGKPKPPGA